jgi:hypothetical protein
MKPNQESENDGQVTGLLREWTVSTPLPPRFQEQVWQRIARAEATTKSSFGQTLAHWIDATFRRPALAFCYVTVLLSGGLTVGYWHAQEKSDHIASQSRTLYVQSVDPYQMPRH